MPTSKKIEIWESCEAVLDRPGRFVHNLHMSTEREFKDGYNKLIEWTDGRPTRCFQCGQAIRAGNYYIPFLSAKFCKVACFLKGKKRAASC